MLSLSLGYRASTGAVALLLLLGAGGCKPKEPITKYTAPYEKAIEETPPDPPEPASAGERILALIAEGVPNDGQAQWWFFKMRGRPEAVGRRIDGMKQLVASLRIPNDPSKLPEYKTPEGWEFGRSNQQFGLFAFKTGHRVTPLNVEVSRVGGDLLQNVNRWRTDQMGIPAWEDADFQKLLSKPPQLPTTGSEFQPLPVPEGAKKIYWVDLRGPGVERKMPPFVKQ